jgi:succinylglutamate desuccinylase
LPYHDFGDPHVSYQKRFCFIAGVHGNEPAASLLLERLLKTDYFQQKANALGVFIRVIPSVNEFGLRYGIRFQNSFLYPDINRTFEHEGNGFISKEMIRLTKDIRVIIDFHEGWGFHRIHPSSLGSTLTVSDSARPMAERIIERLNQTISNRQHQFMILERMCEIKAAFSCYCNKREKTYILVETTGQNDVQPITERQRQIQIIIDTAFINTVSIFHSAF